MSSPLNSVTQNPNLTQQEIAKVQRNEKLSLKLLKFLEKQECVECIAFLTAILRTPLTGREVSVQELPIILQNEIKLYGRVSEQADRFRKQIQQLHASTQNAQLRQEMKERTIHEKLEKFRSEFRGFDLRPDLQELREIVRQDLKCEDQAKDPSVGESEKNEWMGVTQSYEIAGPT